MATKDETVECLRRARERIADRARWCTGSLAVDDEGCSVRPASADAVAWCALGALGELVPGGPDAAYHLLVVAADEGFGRPVSCVNDVLGHAAVLALYDDAIARAERAVSA